MVDSYRFLPAAAFSLDALASLFTRAFEGYRYAMDVTPEMMAQRVRTENIELQRSVVLELGGVTAGIAVVGLRGAHAWCGGFGLVAGVRGRGLAVPLARAMIEQVRAAGAHRLSLEVLAGNQPALATYLRVGMRVERDLLLLRWSPADAATGEPVVPANPAIREAEPRQLLAQFDALHPAPAAWQRDLPSLLVRGGLRGLALYAGERVAAYTLFHTSPTRQIQLADIGADHVEAASSLLRALRGYGGPLVSVNEPADSPLTAAFQAEGWAEFERQHELVIDL